MTQGFWDWAVVAYGAPGVADECLHLQDAHEQNVPLLLWAAWCAETGRTPDEEALEEACDTARIWADQAVIPLRALRRSLKVRRPDMDDGDREAVRKQIKTVELEAERRLMKALESLAPVTGGARGDTQGQLIRVARQWSERVPRPALIHLAERLAARLPA